MKIKARYRGLASEIRLRVANAALALAVVLVPGAIATPSARAQTYQVLYSFTGGRDGQSPDGSLVQDTNGYLYGTTYYGGAYGCGDVFKVSPNGAEIVLYSFTGGMDGANPHGGLVQDAPGNLYGVTNLGGAHGAGTVFKLDKTGKETVLYSFAGFPDGLEPTGSLVRDGTGDIYGTTYDGGNLCSWGYGCGTVFKVDTTGTETVLYRFLGPPEGQNPDAGLVRGPRGNLYGTTSAGGNLSCAAVVLVGCGTVFKEDAVGRETVLHSFTGGADGAIPAAALIRDTTGNLYGTTSEGGDFFCVLGCGTVFKVDSTGKETVLYKFTGSPDGANPDGGLVQDAAGNLYGTTSSGGIASTVCPAGCGTVFKLDATGIETVLHSFTAFAGGAYPDAGLVRDAAGNLYGTTPYSGAYGNGVVFVLKPF